MKTEPSIYGIIRSIFQVVGAYLIGHVIWGFTFTADWLEALMGILFSAISITWSIKAKTATIEMVQGFIRESMSFVFALLGTFGLITDTQAIAYIGLAMAFAPTIYAYFSRLKTKQLDVGVLNIKQLKQ